MSYPKMLYWSEEKFSDQKALEAGLLSGALKTRIVLSADDESAAVLDGWTDDLVALIKRKSGRPPKSETGEE